MFAVLKTGGKQYLVKEGETIRVEKLPGEVGTKVSFDMLLKADGDKIGLGAPLLSEKVTGEILSQGRGQKISVVKYKAKSRYTRRVGHRQFYTAVKIEKIG